MTEAAFWSMIRSALRQKTRFWKPILEAKKKAKRNSKSKNKRLKYEYQCNHCKEWFPDKKISVDHIIPAGTLASYEDLPRFVKNLFVEKDELQVLCNTCHQKKTNDDRKKGLFKM